MVDKFQSFIYTDFHQRQVSLQAGHMKKKIAKMYHYASRTYEKLPYQLSQGGGRERTGRGKKSNKTQTKKNASQNCWLPTHERHRRIHSTRKTALGMKGKKKTKYKIKKREKQSQQQEQKRKKKGDSVGLSCAFEVVPRDNPERCGFFVHRRRAADDCSFRKRRSKMASVDLSRGLEE